MFNKLINKAKAGWYVIKYMSKILTCEATGQVFWLPKLIEESLVLPDIFVLDEQGSIEARSFLYKISNNKLSDKETNVIIDSLPSLGIISLIWERYGILHPSLTIYLIGFYGSRDKETAEVMASSYCLKYLDMTINPILSYKTKFVVEILPVKEENEIRLKVFNKECSYEFLSPKAMPSIVSDISEKYIGLN